MGGGGVGLDADEARRVLGVAPEAGAAEVRSAFRRALRAAHPDVAPGTTDAGVAVSRLVRALAVLQATPVEVLPPPAATPAGATGTATATAEGEELLLDAPPDEAFVLLLRAADVVGDVTHAEPENGLLEAVVVLPGTTPSSLLVTLQGRAAGTEAFCTLEPLAPGPVPLLTDVVGELARVLARPPG